MSNLGQVSAIVLTDTEPTNINILWKKSTEDVPFFYDTTNLVWLPLNTLGATITFPNTDPTTITIPPSGQAVWGWYNGDFWWLDDTGTIHYNADGKHQFFNVATLTDRNNLINVKYNDRCTVSGENNNSLNGEYWALTDNPISLQWSKIVAGSVEEAPTDNKAHVRKDAAWEEGYTVSQIDDLNAGFIKVDGSNEFDAAYLPVSDQQPATVKTVKDELSTKEDFLGVPVNNGYILSGDVAGNRIWIPVPADTDNFISLTDTPASYAGSGDEFIKVKNTEDGLVFSTIPPSSTTYLALTDTPFSYVGQSGKVPVVNALENGMEFNTLIGGGNLLSNGSITMDGAYTPVAGRGLVYKDYVDNADALKEDDLGNPAINGQALVSTAVGARSWITLFNKEFSGLSDTPDDYAGAINYNLVVNGSGTGITFQEKPNLNNVFTGLADTPDNYTGQSGHAIIVNPAENGLTFATIGDIGNLKSDGSIPMDALWIPLIDQDISTKKYVDDNIGSGNLLSDGSVSMDAGYDPANMQDIATLKSVKDYAGLVRIEEGTPVTKFGYRLFDANIIYHGDIGTEAVDMMHSTALIADRGAIGDYSLSANQDTLSSGLASVAMGRLTEATRNYTLAGGHETRASGVASFVWAWGQTIKPVETLGNYSAILAGTSGSLGINANNSVMLGGIDMIGNMPETVYIPQLKFLPKNAPVTPEEGTLYYDQTEKTFYYWDGIQWIDLAGSTLCTDYGFIDSLTAPTGTPDTCGYYTATHNADYILFNPPAGGLLNVLTGDKLTWNGTEWFNAGQASTGTFTGLTDTPNDYAGNAGKFTSVNPAEDALIFVEPPSLTQGYGNYIYEAGAGVPVSGNFTLNDADITLVTQLNVHYINQSLTNISGFLKIVATGSFISFVDDANPNNTLFYQIDAVTDQPLSNYVEYTVTFVSDTGTITIGETFNTENTAGQADLITKFTGLSDTPVNYTAQAGKTVRVNEDGITDGDGDALEFVTVGGNLGQADLLTVPTSVGQYGDYYEAIVDGDYINFNPPAGGLSGVLTGDKLTWNGTDWEIKSANGISTFLNLTDTPVDYADKAHNLVRVNAGETVLEFIEDKSVLQLFRFKYDSDTNILIPPALGYVKFNTPSPSNATIMYVSEENADGIYIIDLLWVIADGNIAALRTSVYGVSHNVISSAGDIGGWKYGLSTLTDDIGVLPADDEIILITRETKTMDFTKLPDTPANYTGAAGLIPVVNPLENALEFKSKINEPTADGLFLRKVTDIATTPVYSWSEEIDGGNY